MNYLGKIGVCAITFFLFSFLGIFNHASAQLSPGFSNEDISGEMFYVTSIDYPATGTFLIEWTTDGMLLDLRSGQVDGTYTVQNGVINLMDVEGQNLVLTPFAFNNMTYIIRLDAPGLGFEVDTNFNANFSSLNNSAVNLKDWFITNGFWPGSTVTADGRITYINATYEGAWWIANNTFFFDFPEPGSVGHKAYKLVNDVLLFSSDAEYMEFFTMALPAGFAQSEIVSTAETVNALAADQVTTTGNQGALGNFLRQAMTAIQEEDTVEAINKVEKAIARTDGCVFNGIPDGNAPGKDWITDCNAQTSAYESLVDAMDALAP